MIGCFATGIDKADLPLQTTTRYAVPLYLCCVSAGGLRYIIHGRSTGNCIALIRYSSLLLAFSLLAGERRGSESRSGHFLMGHFFLMGSRRPKNGALSQAFKVLLSRCVSVLTTQAHGLAAISSRKTLTIFETF